MESQDAPTPDGLESDVATLAALGGSDSDAAVLDADRENARRQVRARLFATAPEPLRFGRYVLLSNLGEGGTGMVYAAYDDTLDRKVAIKVLRPEIAEGELGAKRLIREARAMARLSDPNIVAVHEVGEQDGQVFIAMEFVRGRNAAEWLRDGERSTQEILDAYHQAARGLVAAHRAGLVHRDFKPHNMLVADDGVVKVMDFGLARTTLDEPDDEPATPVRPEDLSPGDLGQTRLTRTGAILGTPAYMSPEQYQALPVDARSDQFSFCVALHQALYGEHPFLTGSLGELMASVCEGRVRDSRSASVPPYVRRALLRGLSVDPAERFPTMQELAAALRHDPAAHRRRWIVRGALTAAVFGGGFALARVGSTESSAEPASCDRGEALVQEVWDDARRDQIRTAMLATERPYAPDTWARVDAELVGYVERWAASHDDACRRHRDGEQSGELLDLRMACLQQDRAALDALATVLGQTDADTIAHAIDVVMGLPRISRCSDVDGLLADVAPPDDPRVAEQVSAHRQTLARLEVLEHAGQWDEGLRSSSALLPDARALGYAPLVAEVQLRRGSTLLLQRQGAEAKAALDEALEGAVRAGHHRVAAEALARRLFVESELLGSPKTAHHDVPIAQAMADFVGHAGTQTLLLNNIGAIHGRLGNREQCVQALEAAMAAQDQEDGGELLGLGVPLNNLALMLIEDGHYVDAVGRLEQLETLREQLYGPRHPLLLETRAHQSLVLAYLLRFDDAERLAMETLREQEAIFGEDSVALLRVLEALAALNIRRRRYDEARTWGTRAKEIAERTYGTGSPVATGVRMQLGHALWHVGEREQVREIMETSIAAIRQALGPEHAYLASAYWQWGDLLRSTSTEEAEPLLERAVKTFEAADPNGHGVAWARITLARLHRSTGRLAEAEEGLTRALAEVEALGLPGASPQLAEVTWRLGEVLLDRGSIDAAVAMLDRAWDTHRALRDPDDPKLALVAFVRAKAQAALADASGRPRPAGLDADVRGFADQLRAGGPAFSEELDALNAWVAGEPPSSAASSIDVPSAG